MDPLTHGLLGASLGQALCGPALGRRALGWGAVLAMAPDVDILRAAPTRSPSGDGTAARPTGSSVVLAAGCLLGYLLARALGRRAAELDSCWPSPRSCRTRCSTSARPRARSCWRRSRRRRFALDWVAIVDPAYSLMLAAGLVIGVRAGATTSRAPRRRRGRRCCRCSLYLALGGFVNARIESIARDDLRAKRRRVLARAAYPTLLQLPFRRIVARSGDEVRVGWLSLLRPLRSLGELHAGRGPLVDAALARRPRAGSSSGSRWARRRRASRRRRATASSSSTTCATASRARRATASGACASGSAADGRPLGAGERFSARCPRPSRSLLYTIWRETLGWS